MKGRCRDVFARYGTDLYCMKWFSLFHDKMIKHTILWSNKKSSSIFLMLLFLLDTWRTLPQMLAQKAFSVNCKHCNRLLDCILVSTVSIKQENVFIKSYIKKKILQNCDKLQFKWLERLVYKINTNFVCIMQVSFKR